MLVIAGSLLGTALITGSFIVGDTLGASIRAKATSQLGPIDQIVNLPDAGSADAVREAIDALGDDRIDGTLRATVAPAALATGEGEQRGEPRAQLLEMDLGAARGFGGDPGATGIEGDTPGPGETVISEDLATTLEVGPGDKVSAFIYGQELELTVARVLPRLGVAGFWTGYEARSPNAFVPPGTLDDALGSAEGGDVSPPRHLVFVSNRGDVEGGADLTEEVVPLIEGVIEADEVRVEPVKRDTLRTAEEQGDAFSQLFVAVGSFAIVAGVLLLVNIFVMLSEERKNQLGMLRAIGMKRSDLVRTFAIEGAMYSIIAAALGAVLGIGVGWAIVMVAAPIFRGAGDFALDLLFSMDVASLIGGFCLGLLISAVTVFFTSIRISRINIIRAIRDLAEPPRGKTRKRVLFGGLLLAAIGAAWFAGSIQDDARWAGLILGPLFFAWGLVPLMGRLISRRYAVIAAASFTLFWGIAGNTLLDGRFFRAGDLFAFVLQGTSLTFGAVLLLSQAQEALEGTFRRLAARRLALRLGLAYPLARRFRTGLTLGMFALVMFTMVFIAQMSEVFGGQVETITEQTSGGADLLVTSSEGNPVSVEELSSVDGIAEVAPVTSGQVLYDTEMFDDPASWPVAGVTRGLLELGPPPLQEEKAEGLSSDEEAWQMLLDDPGTVIINDYFLQGGGGPPATVVAAGESIGVIDPLSGRTVERKVIATLRSDAAFAGSYMSRASLGEVVGDRATLNRFHVNVEEGRDLSELTTGLQGRFMANGVDAATFRDLVEEQNQLSLQFLRLMQGYLALGLLVGIAGLGVVMVRAVRERRRQVGVLRSLGFVPAQIRRAFLFESSFIAVEGIVVGAVLAVITSAQLVANGDFGEGLSFSIAWGQILVICAAAIVASSLATLWPAQQASRIPPAVALRIAD